MTVRIIKYTLKSWTSLDSWRLRRGRKFPASPTNVTPNNRGFCQCQWVIFSFSGLKLLKLPLVTGMMNSSNKSLPLKSLTLAHTSLPLSKNNLNSCNYHTVTYLPTMPFVRTNPYQSPPPFGPLHSHRTAVYIPTIPWCLESAISRYLEENSETLSYAALARLLDAKTESTLGMLTPRWSIK